MLLYIHKNIKSAILEQTNGPSSPAVTEVDVGEN